MERLRTLEAMQLEQKLQMEELDAMGKVDVRQYRPAEDDEYARMCAPQDHAFLQPWFSTHWKQYVQK